MAFQIEVKDTGRKPYGAITFSARTDVDLTKREVLVYDFEIKQVTIPGIQDYEIEYSVLRESLANHNTRVPLDLVLAYLPQDIPVAKADNLSTEPPPIFVSSSPAVLLFEEIPGDHSKAYIRSSIPGTREAWEAAIGATVGALKKPGSITVPTNTVLEFRLAQPLHK